MLDSQLAERYDVPTFRLNEAVKRNLCRFPPDFMFQLNRKEADSLPARGGRRTLPYVFTAEGIVMLSTVLRSDRAIATNIAIIRASVPLPKIGAPN